MDPTHPAFDFCDSARRTDGAVFVNHLWTAATLRAAALDSLRSLRMWSTTTFLALLQYAIPAEFGGGVGRADRTC